MRARDAGTTGTSAPLAFCIFNFVGAVRVQTMGVMVHKTFPTDRIKRCSRKCVGVFHPPVVRNSAKLLSIWRKVKRKALLMEFLARNYGGIICSK